MDKDDVMDKPHTLIAPSCRICRSVYCAYLKDVPSPRMKTSTALYYCMNCGSFQHPQVYHEDDGQLKRDAAWHLSVEERNNRWSQNFWKTASARGVSSLIEIGCGTGTLMAVGREMEKQAVGYEVNPYAVEIAKRNELDVRHELWSSETLSEKYDLVTAISVFEHLPNPRELMEQVATYCRQWGSQAFISVPFATEKEDWFHLLEENPTYPENPLYLVDVHINHFSKRGFVTMAADFGATHIEFLPCGWWGYWLKFD